MQTFFSKGRDSGFTNHCRTARRGSCDILEINRDDSPVCFLSTGATASLLISSFFFSFFFCGKRDEIPVLLLRTVCARSPRRGQVIGISFTTSARYPNILGETLHREIIYARAEIRVIISRDKSVGRATIMSGRTADCKTPLHTKRTSDSH